MLHQYVKKSDFYIYKYLFQIEVNVLDYDNFSNSQLSIKALISLLIMILVLNITVSAFRIGLFFHY